MRYPPSTRRIGDLATQEAATQRKIDWNTVQLNAAKNSLKLHDDLLKKRLVDIYENGDLSYASVLALRAVVQRFRGTLGRSAPADRRERTRRPRAQGRRSARRARRSRLGTHQPSARQASKKISSAPRASSTALRPSGRTWSRSPRSSDATSRPRSPRWKIFPRPRNRSSRA